MGLAFRWVGFGLEVTRPKGPFTKGVGLGCPGFGLGRKGPKALGLDGLPDFEGEGRISAGEFPSSDGAQNSTKTCHSIYQIEAPKVRNRNIPLVPVIVVGVGRKTAWKPRVSAGNWVRFKRV